MRRIILKKCLRTARTFRSNASGLLGFFLIIAIFFSLIFTLPKAWGGTPSPTPEWIVENIESLRDSLLTKKQIEHNYEQSILAALTYYPDLNNVCIRFRRRAIGTTMAARPTLRSFFAPRGNRCYLILINTKQTKQKAPLAKEAPFDARVGVFAHELGHIVDYENKSMLTILGNGIAYLISARFKHNLEQQIDSIAIARGAGSELIEFRLFVEEHPDVTPQYLKFKRRIYLSSDEIAAILDGWGDGEEDEG